MHLMRGFKDTLPSQITDRVFNGLYGAGVYLTLREEVAYRYGAKSSDVFGITVSYNPRVEWLTLKEGVHFDCRSNLESEMKLTKKGKKTLGITEDTIRTCDLMSKVVAAGFNILAIELDFCCENTVVATGYEYLEFVNFKFYILDNILESPAEETMDKMIRDYNKWFNTL